MVCILAHLQQVDVELGVVTHRGDSDKLAFLPLLLTHLHLTLVKGRPRHPFPLVIAASSLELFLVTL